jgi:N-hydroxyarylamine O-acetyltransferase
MTVASNFNLVDYLARTSFDGTPKADLETLSKLVQKQLQSVPFENTEVQAGRIPSLAPEDIVTKIITNKHGGYCYEINGLFAMALTTIGFKWYFAGARPMFYPTRRPKTHMVVIVELDGVSYLCDAGFGGYGLREPLVIAGNAHVVQNGDEFKMELIDGEYVLSSSVNGEWMRQYGFALIPQEWIEFGLANHFNATHQGTIFTQKKLAIMQTANGRKILIDDELKIIENGNLQKLSVKYEDAIKEHFGLNA